MPPLWRVPIHIREKLVLHIPKKAQESRDWIAPQPHRFFPGKNTTSHQITLLPGAQLYLKDFLSRLIAAWALHALGTSDIQTIKETKLSQRSRENLDVA